MTRIKRKGNNQEAPADLTLWQEADLTQGGCEDLAEWLSPEEKRAAWEKYCAELMEDYRDSGKRPAGYWLFDRPGALDPYRDKMGKVSGPAELQAIIDLGLASPYEIKLHRAGVDPHEWAGKPPLYELKEEEIT